MAIFNSYVSLPEGIDLFTCNFPNLNFNHLKIKDPESSTPLPISINPWGFTNAFGAEGSASSTLTCSEVEGETHSIHGLSTIHTVIYGNYNNAILVVDKLADWCWLYQKSMKSIRIDWQWLTPDQASTTISTVFICNWSSYHIIKPTPTSTASLCGFIVPYSSYAKLAMQRTDWLAGK